MRDRVSKPGRGESAAHPYPPALSASPPDKRPIASLPAPLDEDEPRAGAWLSGEPGEELYRRFEPPEGFTRRPSPKGSFASFLRRLPLKKKGARVHLHDGSLKNRQDVHAAVIDMDVGSRDLQQCADAVMRLRAEYLFATGRGKDICFFTAAGDKLAFRQGTHGELRKHLDRVFAFANTASLLKQMEAVSDEAHPEIGDVYIVPAGRQGYGHAVIVVDAADAPDGRRAVLLAQSYMPAQEIHVLVSFENPSMSPWHLARAGEEMRTPEWTFPPGSLHRFTEGSCVSSKRR